MIAKTLISGYDTSTAFPASVLLPAFSKGFDKDTLHKEASMFEDMYNAFERKPDHTYIHLISVAAGEQYGPNSRADFYNGHPYEVIFPYPEKGGRKAIMLDGGIEKYHPTFDKEGAVYTEHRSGREGFKPQGYIVVSGFNKDMQRGELIIGVKTDLWRDDIEKLSKGTPLRFSIGADAKRDVCLPSGSLILTRNGQKPIEQIKPGEIVFTVQGHWCGVINTMHRLATELTTIHVEGLPKPVKLTPNHPVHIVERFGKDFDATWVEAGKVVPGTYVKKAIEPFGPIYDKSSVEDGYVYLKVVKVETEECDFTDVYNLEVADDNSYIAEGLPVHNCSICGHEAKTEPGHCDHYKNERGVIYDDGNQQYVISDNLVFHDISRVRNPAEKIAFSIRKVASNGLGFDIEDHVKPHLSSVPYMLKTAKAKKKFETLKKLSKIEKKIIAESKGGVLDPGLVNMFHVHGNKDSAEALNKFLRVAHDDNELIGAMDKEGVLLPPEEFADVFVPEDARPLVDIDDYKAAIPGIFNRLLERDDVDEFCADETYDPKPCCNGVIIHAVIDYKNGGGFSPERAVDEALSRFFGGESLQDEEPRIIIVKRDCRDTSDALAEEYANYMLSSADNYSDDALVAALLRAML